MKDAGAYIAVLACALLAGVSLNRFSKFLKMPILLCFLGIGMLFGQHGLEFFPACEMGKIQFFGELALCFIIFTGGLETSFSSIRKVLVTGTILSTIGVILTALCFATFIYVMCKTPFWVNCSFTEALVVGAIFSSTDAAAVFAILRGQKAALNPNLQALLEYESGSNDPAAFLLTTLVLDILKKGIQLNFAELSWSICSGIFWGLGVGAAVGFLFGLFGQWFFNWIQSFLEYNGLRFVAAIAIVLLCFGCNNAFFQANSLMMCYVAGITMGNLRFNFKQSFIYFHDGVSWLMQILLFTILGSLFDYHRFFNLKTVLTAVLSALVLMFIVRPAVVMLCMTKSPFGLRERILASWVGIRGSAPIMLAALVLATVPAQGRIYALNLFYVVFIVVLLSILFQGSSILWAAKKLKLLLPYEEKEEPPLEYTDKTDDREMHQFTVSAGSPLIDRRLDACGLGENGPVLLMIKRGKIFIQPQPRLFLEEGDALSFLGEHEAIRELHQRYFPQEEYTTTPTFSQLWKKIARRYLRRRLRRHRKNSK